MRRTKPKPAPHPAQLELPLGLVGSGFPPLRGVWKAVAELPAKAALEHRRRRKVVKPKLRQVEVLAPPEDD